MILNDNKTHKSRVPEMQNFHTISKVKNSYSRLSSMLENLGKVTFYEKNNYSLCSRIIYHFKIDVF